MDKRPDPWADFLRRILVTASLAGIAAVPASGGKDTTPPTEVAEVEPLPPASGPAAEA